MAKAYTLEYVKKYIESFDCKLYSEVYNNGFDILDILYICGHRELNNFRTFIRKSRKVCNLCSFKHTEETRKMWEDFWINKTKDFGFEFIEFQGDYINENSKISFKCQLDHISTMKIKQFQINKTCVECARIESRKSFKEKKTISIETAIIKLHEQHGDSIIMNNYIGMHSYADFECVNCGYKWSTIAGHVLNNGDGCNVCTHKNGSIKHIVPIEEIIEELHRLHGNTIDLVRYVSIGESADFKCNICGHEWSCVAFGVIRKGTGCSVCSFKNISGANSPMWKGGITPISTYLRNLLEDWINKSLISTHFLCDITGKSAEVIHHLYPFHNIVKETFDKLGIQPKNEVCNYTQEEIDLISFEFLELHSKYPLGKPMSKKYHIKFHNLYSKNATPEDYYEFKSKVLSGEIII